MKKPDKKLEAFIKKCKAENKGHLPQIMGSNGFRMDLTVENYEKVKKMVRDKIEAGEFEEYKNK